ncbi:STM2901 family protein [Erwinia pyrifoliae]|uniref:Phage membrane protein n=1 Tax=Erwinia pyrifoliae TaxID=79967 RepID=A0ABY5X512_ERWPY|nr:hypothetical protein [Erwinia pyrifoliae]MCT2388239.1 hypothetical protein [Erwinia pyrifoliae]MCU8586409.1 hypothetical protein [Erwinia pyrifoliae]UWS32470.1 hypothetical protein NYP84_12590 [Erwinia pyrifoliae]
MDTTEQLNGTYFYGGLTNLTPGELFFWVMIDVTAEHYTGAKDVMAAAAVYSGQNTIAVSGKFGKATPGTSFASTYSRKLLRGYMLPFKLPTFIQSPSNPFAIKRVMTFKLATFVGRTIPVVGWVVLGADAAQIGYKSMVIYNRIVSKDDQIW